MVLISFQLHSLFSSSVFSALCVPVLTSGWFQPAHPAPPPGPSPWPPCHEAASSPARWININNKAVKKKLYKRKSDYRVNRIKGQRRPWPATPHLWIPGSWDPAARPPVGPASGLMHKLPSPYPTGHVGTGEKRIWSVISGGWANISSAQQVATDAQTG